MNRLEYFHKLREARQIAQKIKLEKSNEKRKEKIITVMSFIACLFLVGIHIKYFM